MIDCRPELSFSLGLQACCVTDLGIGTTWTAEGTPIIFCGLEVFSTLLEIPCGCARALACCGGEFPAVRALPNLHVLAVVCIMHQLDDNSCWAGGSGYLQRRLEEHLRTNSLASAPGRTYKLIEYAPGSACCVLSRWQ